MPRYVYGTNSDDRLYGLTGFENVIYGYAGHDVLIGANLRDWLYGDDGDDWLSGNGGNDHLDGGHGNDTLIGGMGVDTYAGGDGFDTVYVSLRNATRGAYVDLGIGRVFDDGFGNAETLSSIECVMQGTGFSDTFVGSEAANGFEGNYDDIILARGGDDLINVGGAPRILDGGAGIDTLFMGIAGWFPDADGDFNAEILVAGRGVRVDLAQGRILDDGFGYSGSLMSIENVYGGALDDWLAGDASANHLDGRDGMDVLYGGGGDDILFGGNGNDSLSGDEGDDSLGGGNGDDLLHGADGDDFLDGGNGDDLLRGGSGQDSYFGGAGNDRISLYNRDAIQAAYVDLRIQQVLDDGFGNVETLSSIEGVGQGTAFVDTFHGSDLANVILGGAGDFLHAHGGDDRLIVHGAPQILDGGAGSDRIEFGSDKLVPDQDGDGLADIVYATSGVSVDLAQNLILDDGFGDTGAIVGIENVTGTAFADRLIGDGVANRIEGFGGDDQLGGGGGDDLLLGGEGRDTLLGGDGRDNLQGEGGDDMLDGGAADDILIGGAGRDILFGGSGNDVLRGGGDADLLTGGLGSDRFVFESFAVGKPGLPGGRWPATDLGTVTDLGKGDLIDLSAIDAVPGGRDDAFRFVSGGTFTGSAGQLLALATPKGYVIAGDLDGDRMADFTLSVNVQVLTADHFVL